MSAYEQVKKTVLRRIEDGDIDPAASRSEVRAAISDAVDAYQQQAALSDGVTPASHPEELVERVLASVVDYGPLTDLLAADDIEEILIQGERVSYITSDGRVQYLAPTASEQELRQYVERLLATSAEDVQLDRSSPVDSVGLPGGDRLSVKIPPAADELTVAYRKVVAKRPTLAGLVADGVMTAEAASFLWALMQTRSRVLVAGAKGAGKTTLINALLAAIPAHRVVRVNEEERELTTPLMVGGYTRADDRKPGQTLRELIRADLRFRPDVLVVGEVRGEEAYELLRPLNAGCGFLSAVHANAASTAIEALAEAATTAVGTMDEAQLRRQFARYIDFVVFIDADEHLEDADSPDNRRQITDISWVTPELRDGQVVYEPLLCRDELGLPLYWTGARPRPEVERRLERAIGGATVKDLLAGETTLVGGAP